MLRRDAAGGPTGTPVRPRALRVAKSTAYWQVATYREAYGIAACTGILFNHESGLRPERFVTRKIVSTACRIRAGSSERLRLGDVTVVRDWGWADEYVDAMWRMLTTPGPLQDFVIATGETNSLEAFVARCSPVRLDGATPDVDSERTGRPRTVSRVTLRRRRGGSAVGRQEDARVARPLEGRCLGDDPDPRQRHCSEDARPHTPVRLEGLPRKNIRRSRTFRLSPDDRGLAAPAPRRRGAHTDDERSPRSRRRRAEFRSATGRSPSTTAGARSGPPSARRLPGYERCAATADLAAALQATSAPASDRGDAAPPRRVGQRCRRPSLLDLPSDTRTPPAVLSKAAIPSPGPARRVQLNARCTSPSRRLRAPAPSSARYAGVRDPARARSTSPTSSTGRSPNS